VLHEGEWTLLEIASAGDSTFTSLVAYAWRRGAELVIVAVNLADRDAQGLVQLSDLPEGAAFSFDDRLSDRRYRWDREKLRTGVYVRLPGGGAHVFEVSRTAD
jgi:hypothetical protein